MAKAIVPPVPRPPRVDFDEAGVLTPELKNELSRLAQGLHESGALAFLVALTEQTGTITEEMAEWVNFPQNRRMLQNLAAMYGLLQQVDPAALTTLGRALERGWREAGRTRRADRPPSLRSLWREWNDPDVRRGLQAVLGFLRGVGRPEASGPSKPWRPV